MESFSLETTMFVSLLLLSRGDSRPGGLGAFSWAISGEGISRRGAPCKGEPPGLCRLASSKIGEGADREAFVARPGIVLTLLRRERVSESGECVNDVSSSSGWGGSDCLMGTLTLMTVFWLKSWLVSWLEGAGSRGFRLNTFIFLTGRSAVEFPDELSTDFLLGRVEANKLSADAARGEF